MNNVLNSTPKPDAKCIACDELSVATIINRNNALKYYGNVPVTVTAPTYKCKHCRYINIYDEAVVTKDIALIELVQKIS